MRRREVLRYEGKRRKERRKPVSCLLEHMPGLPFYHPPDFYKVFIEFFYNIVLYLGFVFGCEAGGLLAPYLGIKLEPPTLESEAISTGPPGKFPTHL